MNRDMLEVVLISSGPPGGEVAAEECAALQDQMDLLLLNCNIKIEPSSGCAANGVCKEVAAVVKWPLRTSPPNFMTK